MKPLVAIVGRPNVGKSTLFNKILGQRKAVATDEPGVTRDLNFAEVEEGRYSFTLVDTGGFEAMPAEAITEKIREQALVAIEEADIIIFLMDGREGLTADDREISRLLRKAGKPVFYGVNKIDAPKLEDVLTDFYTLGVETLFPVSAEHGGGVYELLEAVTKEMEPAPPGDVEGEVGRAAREGEGLKRGGRARVAIVGRPNAGKSSILNRLLGKERAIVSDLAGTTRDSIDTPFDSDGSGYVFIDTAGIRKKGKISRRVETYCVMEAIKSIERSDVALLVVDAGEGVSVQDEKIAGLVERRGKGCVVVINKWDSIEKDTMSTKRYTESVRERIPFLSYAPVLFVSALTGKRVDEILDAVDRVAEELGARIQTSKLNRLLEEITRKKSPPLYRGRNVKFYYITQAGTYPPAFAVFSNYPDAIPESYRRYMVNSIRRSLELKNVPIRVYFRKRT